MREIILHRAHPFITPEPIKVMADIEEHGATNIYYFETEHRSLGHLKFQNGPIPEVGVNGITNEIAIACVIDRLESFQRGKSHCADNAIALIALRGALHALHQRTRERLARGVEGTHKP